MKQGLCFYWVKHFLGAAGLNCHGQIQIIVNNFWGQFYVTNNFIARNFGSKLFFSKIIYSQYIFGSQHSFGLQKFLGSKIFGIEEVGVNIFGRSIYFGLRFLFWGGCDGANNFWGFKI